MGAKILAAIAAIIFIVILVVIILLVTPGPDEPVGMYIVHLLENCVCAPILGLFFASKASKKFFALFLNCKGIVNVI